MAERPIFERYGGFSSIRRVVSDFYDHVLDSELAHFFEGVEMRALIDHQASFISYLTGGPGTHYTDAMLHRVHAPLGITGPDFDAMVVLLEQVFEDHDFEREDIAAVSAKLKERRHVVVNGPGPA